MPPSRKQAALSDVSSSTILPRPRGRPRKDANVSLSSTVGAPTPARRTAASSSSSASATSTDRGNISLASTLAPSTPAEPKKKRGRPPKSSLTTPAMRALASADTSVASTSAAPRPRGRPPKSILTTAGSRTLTSPNTSVSFSDQPRKRGRPAQSADYDTTASSTALPKKRGRPPKQRDAASAPATPVPTPRPRGRPPKSALAHASSDVSATASMPASTKRRGRPPGSVNKSRPTEPTMGLPKSRPEKRLRPAEEQDDAASDVSLVDGVSEEESEASEGDPDPSDGEAEALSSADEASSRPRRVKSKKRKGWPSERERLRKWRRLSVEERECITSEGGLIWRTAIPLLNSMPKNIRSMVADSLTRALNRIDAKLETNLVPPLPRIPLGGGPTTLVPSTSTRRDLASSMLSWRLEEEGSLLLAENPSNAAAVMSLGMNAEITELEQMLLPEAEQIVELSKTLEHQSAHLDRSKAEIAKLKRDRKATKSGGNSDYPPNLEAHEFLSITAHKPDLDPALASTLRLAERP